MRHSSVPAIAIAVALIVGACGSPSTTSRGSANPTGSAGAGGCPTAPDPGQPAGWTQPSTPPSVIPVFINTSGELTCGQNRFLFSFIDARTNLPVGAPDRTATVAFFDLARDASKPTVTADSSFVWAIEDERGVYVSNVEFSEAGVWGAEFTTQGPDGKREAIRATFQVAPSSPVVRVGQPAPSTKTPTAADVGGDLSKISTDGIPDPALYKTSVDTALAKHQPFVLAFATPKFCKTGQCGPTLDRLKPFASQYPTVAFIHAEPYKLEFQDGRLQPVLTNGQLTPTDVVNKWGLLSEPWVFVVDRDGIVRGSFELIFSDAELKALLDKVK